MNAAIRNYGWMTAVTGIVIYGASKAFPDVLAGNKWAASTIIYMATTLIFAWSEAIGRAKR